MAEHFHLKLVDSHMLAPTVRHMVFERDDNKPLALKAGQFVQIHLHYDDGKPTRRSFSVASVVAADADTVDKVELAVSYVEGGLATRVLGELKQGESVEATGSFGRFYFFDDDANSRYLLVATGTGIAPFRALLPRMAKMMRERGCTFELLYGVRNPAELLYGDEFEAFAAEHPGFRFHACLSREMRPEPHPCDHHGHVQDLLAGLAPDPAHDIAYLCGNPAMVDDTYARLVDAGLSIRYIRREKYVSSR
ncbi:MAG TPA: FAD-binding oxidoreductase [Rhodanobacteraceae bacterium]